MKKIMATAIIALAPATAMAADGNIYDGFGSLAAGYNSYNAGEYSEQWGGFEGGEPYVSDSDSGNSPWKADGLDLEIRASAAVPLGGSFAAQVDGVFTRTNYKWNDCSGPGCTMRLNETTIATHAFWRDPGKGLVGIVGQRSASTSNWAGGITTYYIGGEGQAYFGKATVYGQVTYGSADYVYNDIDGVNAALQLRYFPQDNLMIALKGSYEEVTFQPDSSDCTSSCWKDKSTTWLIGAKAEYRLPNSKFSLFTDIDYRDNKYRSSYTSSSYWEEYEYKYHDFRAMVGVKINFGARSLFERDRSGASLDPVRPLAPQFFGGVT